jgi:hypothetical protein
MTTPAELRAIRKKLSQRIVYTPRVIRQIKKKLAQGRPNTGRLS